MNFRELTRFDEQLSGEPPGYVSCPSCGTKYPCYGEGIFCGPCREQGKPAFALLISEQQQEKSMKKLTKQQFQACAGNLAELARLIRDDRPTMDALAEYDPEIRKYCDNVLDSAEALANYVKRRLEC